MKSGYTDYRLKLKMMEYENKKTDFLNLVERELNTDNFESNAIQILLSMNELKAVVKELKLNVSYATET